MELWGHCEGGKGGRVSSLYRPIFVNQGRQVATSGDKSHSLSLYDLSTGKATSRGLIGYQPTGIFGFPDEPRAPLCLATTKAIRLYSPSYI